MLVHKSRVSVTNACGLVLTHHFFLLWRAFFIHFLSVLVSLLLRILLVPLLIVLLSITAKNHLCQNARGPLCESSTDHRAFLERITLCVFNCHPCVGHLYISRVETESDGTRRRTGGEVKGKEANGVGSQAVFSLTRNSPSSVLQSFSPDPHSKKASTRLN